LLRPGAASLTWPAIWGSASRRPAPGAARTASTGGLLTTYLSWRWVLFVNAPIGIALMAAAPLAFGESPRQHGRFDLPGAITGTLGLAALVYGLSSAATTANGASHWGDAKVVASLSAAVALLACFVLAEARSPQALMPLRIFANRDRTGVNLVRLCVGTTMFGLFFFLTLFMQAVWGYSALKTGLAYLPMSAAILATSGASPLLVPRIGARPLLLAGSAIAAGGLFWLSRITEHSAYSGGVLGPTIATGAGLGLLFMPLTLVAVAKVDDRDAGLAASLPNVAQQAGGALGLAVLGTVAWTAVAHNIHSQIAAVRNKGYPLHAREVPASITDHALAAGFSRAFEVSALVALLALIITITVIRVSREDLAAPPGSTS